MGSVLVEDEVLIRWGVPHLDPRPGSPTTLISLFKAFTLYMVHNLECISVIKTVQENPILDDYAFWFQIHTITFSIVSQFAFYYNLDKTPAPEKCILIRSRSWYRLGLF